MPDFQNALDFLLKHEGETFFEDKATGEKSMFGITDKFLSYINYPKSDPRDLVRSDAYNIYWSHFWKKYNLDEISSQAVANKILDMMVNTGSREATKLVQLALNSLGLNVPVDGIFGKWTLHGLNNVSLTEDRILEELRLKLIDFYKGIAVGERSKYLKGWLARANDLGREGEKS